MMMMTMLFMMIIILMVIVAWTTEPVLTLQSLDSSNDASYLRLVKCIFRILAETQTNLSDFFGGFPQCRELIAEVICQLSRHTLLSRSFTVIIHQTLNQPG